LVNVKTLILSFNEIEEIEGLDNCGNLLKLDLHNNLIRQIKNLEGKEKMSHLDLTYNWITDWYQIEHIKSNCPNLKELGMRCNPLASKKSYRAQIFTKLNYLQKLDGFSFSDKDKERVNDEMKVISISLIMDAVKDQRKGIFDAGGSDSGDFAAERNAESGDEGIGGPDEDAAYEEKMQKKMEWEKNIELLNLAHRQITMIKNLEAFHNLRKLNLMDNNIVKIESLEACKLLEELSLEKNKIKVIENISHLKYLKKLDLGQNQIQRI